MIELQEIKEQVISIPNEIINKYLDYGQKQLSIYDMVIIMDMELKINAYIFKMKFLWENDGKTSYKIKYIEEK